MQRFRDIVTMAFLAQVKETRGLSFSFTQYLFVLFCVLALSLPSAYAQADSQGLMGFSFSSQLNSLSNIANTTANTLQQAASIPWQTITSLKQIIYKQGEKIGAIGTQSLDIFTSSSNSLRQLTSGLSDVPSYAASSLSNAADKIKNSFYAAVNIPSQAITSVKNTLVERTPRIIQDGTAALQAPAHALANVGASISAFPGVVSSSIGNAVRSAGAGLQAAVNVPIHAITSVKQSIDAQAPIIANKSAAILIGPFSGMPDLAAKISTAPQYLTSGLFAIFNHFFPGQNHSFFWWQNPTPPATAPVFVQPLPPAPRPLAPLAPTPAAKTASTQTVASKKQPASRQVPVTPVTREIIHEKEIITQRIIEQINPYDFSKDPLFLTQLDGLRKELNDSFAARINSLVGNLGFTSNRFDTLYVNKGIQTGSSNIQLIDSSGRIPELSSTYFSTVPGIFSRIGNATRVEQFHATSTSDMLSFAGSGGTTISFNEASKTITITSSASGSQNIFASIGNASSTVQFSAGSTSDVLSFEGIGGTSLTFDSANKKIQISSSTVGSGGAPTGASYLTLGNDSTLSAERVFTAGSNITLTDGGANSTLTVNVANSPTFSGNITVNGTATSTIAGPLVIGSGNVTIANATGKIPGITSAVFQDLSGSNITGLNASNITTGTASVSVGGTGLTSATAYALLAGGTTSTGAFQSISGLGTSGQVLTSNGAGALPTWQTASSGGTITSITGTANQVFVNPTTGAVVLSLPQNIQTTSTPQFLRLGLGQAADASNVFTATASSTGSIIVANQTGSGLIADFQQNGSSRFNVSTAGNVTITGRLITGSGGVNLTNDAGKIPALSSTYLADLSGANLTSLNASNITSGTLGVAQGGTGQTSYTDGQLLIGNSSTGLLSKSTLTAGSNIIITNGNGSITIATNASSTGDVGGPSSSTANAIATFSGTTGKAIQNTAVLIDTSANITGVRTLAAATSLTTPLITTASGDLMLDPTGNTVIKGSTTDSSAGALNVQNSASTTLFFVRNDGNVGIGTASPTALLHVTASTTNTLYLANQTGSGLIADFQQNGSSRFNVSTAGNVTITGRLITGSGGVNLTNDAGKIPALSSTYLADLSGANLTSLNASNITAGTLAVGNGGTGQTSYTDGQLLIGNSATGLLSKSTLTAGSNIIITNGNGSITIATNASSTGDVGGPSSSTANAIATFSGTTGKAIQNTAVLIDTSANITGVRTLAAATSLTTPLITTASGDLILDPTGNTVIKGSTTDSSAGALNVQNSASTTLFFVRNDGNVGIGTASPTALLHVTASTTNTLYLANQTGSGLIADFQQNGSSRFNVSTAGNVTITGRLITGSGSVNLTNDAGNLNASNITFGTLSVTVGGTGLTAYTTGDMLYASAATTLAKLGIGTANTVLTSTGSAPQWSTSLTLAGNLTVSGNTTSSFTGPLTVAGSLFQINSSGFALAPNGTSTTPSFAFTSSGATGIFSPGTNILGITTNSTERLRIDSSGNIGIGETNPLDHVHITGGAAILQRAVASSSQAYIRLFEDSYERTRLGIDDNNSFAVMPGANNVPALTVDTNGITAIDRLEVGGINFDTNAGAVSWADLPVSTGVATSTAESYTAQVGSTSMLTIYGESDGHGGIQNTRVGVGTTAPTGFFHVTSSSTDTLVLANRTGGAGALLDIQQGGNSKFYVTNNGNIGIGTTTVFGNGQRVIGLADATTVPNVNPSGGGLLYSTAGALKWRGSSGTLTNIASADYSEYLPARSSVEHADIVVLSNEANPRNDASAPFFLEKSSSPYQHGIVGVVSSYAGDEKEYDFYQPVTLAGRVPVKVSLENGKIARGDYLTSSSLPGVGMKASHAGQVIGVALEGYDGTSASSTTASLPNGQSTIQGQVVMIVQIGYQGNNLTLNTSKDGKLQDQDQFLVDKDGNQLAFTQDGDIVVKHLVVKQLELSKGGTLTLPKGLNQAIGKATVLEGETRVDVANDLVQKTSEIILTLKSTPPDGITWAAGDNADGKFVIKLSHKAPYNLEFTYLIVNVYNADALSNTSSTDSQQTPQDNTSQTANLLEALNLTSSNNSSTKP